MSSSLSLAGDADDFDEETLLQVVPSEQDILASVHKHIREHAVTQGERPPGYESDGPFGGGDAPPPPPLSPARSHKSTQEQTQELFNVPEIPTYLEAKEARHFQRIHIDEFDGEGEESDDVHVGAAKLQRALDLHAAWQVVDDEDTICTPPASPAHRTSDLLHIGSLLARVTPDIERRRHRVEAATSMTAHPSARSSELQ